MMSQIKPLIDHLISDTMLEDSNSVRGEINAVAWARVSTDMQEDRGLSLPQQLKEIREYASNEGIHIVEEYSEAASAYQKYDKRIKFHEMLKRAKSDTNVNAILVHDLSRFSRDSLRAKELMRELRSAGIRVISLNDPELDPDSVAGTYLEAILLAKNEAYSKDIAFHTKKGCRANVQTYDPETGWAYWNGGQPIWGYSIKRFKRGNDRSGKPIYKSIVVPDDTVVEGKTVSEWAKYCLVELAAKGASLDELRDFCNEHNIPARRGDYWHTSTWHSLLQPHALLKYCGYGVWNVHKRNGKKRPVADWVIVENAQEPLISEEIARAITDSRKEKRLLHSFDRGYSKSKDSPYLLSGGLFTCGRCTSNMQGLKKKGYGYYVCGSQPYRKGMGCGTAVYVPQDWLEDLVIDGLQELLKLSAASKSFVSRINSDIEAIWLSGTGCDTRVEEKLKQVESEITNIRNALLKGLDDITWANKKLSQLNHDKKQLESMLDVSGNPPLIDQDIAASYLTDLHHVMDKGENKAKKKFLRSRVRDIKLAPDRLQVEVTYNVPGPLVKSSIAGALYAAIQNLAPERLFESMKLSIKGRRAFC